MTQTKQDVVDNITRLRAMFKASQHSQARLLAQTLLTESPENHSYRLFLMQALKKLKLWDEAEDLLVKATNDHPEYADYYFQLCLLQFGFSQCEEAKKNLLKAMDLKQNSVPYYYQLGCIEAQLGNHDLAQQHWEQARALYSIPAIQKAAKELDIRCFLSSCAKLGDQEAIKNCDCTDSIKNTYLYFDMNKAVAKDLFQGIDHFSDEYLGAIGKTLGQRFFQCTIANMDIESPYFTVKDGLRKTSGVPQHYIRSVYLLGSSRVFSPRCEDSLTMASFLQAIYTEGGDPVRVVNRSVPGLPVENDFLHFLQCGVKQDDVVIAFTHIMTQMPPAKLDLTAKIYSQINAECRNRGARFFVFVLPHAYDIKSPSDRERLLVDLAAETRPHIDYMGEQRLAAKLFSPEYNLPGKSLCEVIQRPHDLGEVFLDFSHWNHQMNELMARHIYDFISTPFLTEPSFKQTDPELFSFADAKQTSLAYLKRIAVEKYSGNQDISQWIAEVKREDFSGKKIGAIVMNCNPFTWGHFYLIEFAVKQVDHLYIFAVQEDQSIFPFTDRIDLIRKGTAQFGEKVHVVPSGKFIISSFSFPGYFAKEEKIDPSETDSTTDIVVFGSIIAPALGITHRFVGEEPNCAVTNVYNRNMKFLLPAMGVGIYTVPRKQSEGLPISASRVRQCLKDKDFDTIKTLVPPSTYTYLLILPDTQQG